MKKKQTKNKYDFRPKQYPSKNELTFCVIDDRGASYCVNVIPRDCETIKRGMCEETYEKIYRKRLKDTATSLIEGLIRGVEDIKLGKKFYSYDNFEQYIKNKIRADKLDFDIKLNPKLQVGDRIDKYPHKIELRIP